MRYSYKIGTSQGGMVYTEILVPPVTVGINRYRPGQQRGVLGDGSEVDLGYPLITWRFGFLTRAQRDALRVFCPGPSAEVYISTKTNDDSSYHTFKAIMTWPEEEDWQSDRVIDFMLKFQVLQAL